jgi:hypothetical protein
MAIRRSAPERSSCRRYWSRTICDLTTPPRVIAVITASVNRCHFEIDSRIIGLDLLKELMLLEDAPPGARYHYNMASALTTAATAVQGAYDEDPREWCESTWRVPV